MIIKNGLVFTENNTFAPMTVHTSGSLITALTAPDALAEDASVFDATGCYVLPGLTDIHFHGCDGYDFCDGTPEAFNAIGSFALAHGITSICPATMTLPEADLSGICENAAHYRKAQLCGKTAQQAADLIGIHMEGPFINAHKKGAQNDAHILQPDASLLRRLQKNADGLIRLVSLAPELPGAISCIEECHEEFRFSVAHTEADYDTAMAAFSAGADHVTHLFNAMPPFTHRSPGVIGAAFDTPSCFVELICDGVHITPSAIRAAFRLFGEERIVLISDSMEATGKPDGCYQLGGLTVFVSGNRAVLSDGTLAGSVTPLYGCMLTAVSMGIPLESAVRAATINPCRSIGMEQLYGSISVGKKAHFLILNQRDLSITSVIKDGLCLKAPHPEGKPADNRHSLPPQPYCSRHPAQ
ncbi:MAG: N-acetylglucosamine-6-phosphate deacetylase [Lachnospiraceae bacterium]|nr:N-acetylglucosamine-6-phosphate deacetylase [Lachnospiraceae bacterium]